MKGSKWVTRLVCIILVAGTIGGVAVAVGSQGSQSNPLVTLGYLNEKAIPDIMDQVEKAIDAKAETLKKEVQNGTKATFAVLEAGGGKTITLAAGSQILLRSGSAICYDGMIDLTSGETLGGSMDLNHLYIATGNEQKVVTSLTSVFMVQGSYTIN